MTIAEQAIARFGAEHQTLQAIEELTELSLALHRALDGRANLNNILEEMADVQIMMSQLEVMYGKPAAWLTEKTMKLEVRIAKGNA